MDNKNLYIALTLGPIGRISSYAEDTKGIWASSYLFVYIAKQIIRPMYEKRDFLLPQWSKAGCQEKDMRMFAPQSGAGLCPDHYIFKAEEGDFDVLADICDNVYRQTAELIADTIRKDYDKVEQFLRQSIKIYFCEHAFGSDASEQGIVDECNKMLNAMECEDTFPPKEEQNYFKLFFASVNGSFLTRDAYGTTTDDKDPRLIKTIFEYSAGELSERLGTSLVKLASEEMPMPREVCTYHKYIAIVKADGDNMSKMLKAIYDDSQHTIHDLDQQLLEYNLTVGELIRKFGGVPIYTGGDDLLFFAPVMYKGNTIFQLLKRIDSTFNEYMKAVGVSAVPTLSFGLSISYYKFPMFEAKDKAEALLEEAKSQDSNKNRICWSLRKHSGQTIEGVIEKTSEAMYDDIMKLIHNYIAELSDEEWLSSVVYWLAKEEEMLTEVIENDNMLHAYIVNNFNEDVHKDSKKKILAGIEEFLKNHMLTPRLATDVKLSVLRTLYASLRFVLFVKKKER